MLASLSAASEVNSQAGGSGRRNRPVAAQFFGKFVRERVRAGDDSGFVLRDRAFELLLD